MDQAIDQLENGVLMLSAIRFKMHVLFLTTTQVGHFFVAKLFELIALTGLAVVAGPIVATTFIDSTSL